MLPHRPLLGAGDILKPKSSLVSLSLDRWPGFGSGTRLFVFKTQRLAVIARFLRPAGRAAACRYGSLTELRCAHDRLLLGQRATPSICLAGERSSCAAAPLRTFPAGMHTHVPRAAASEARLYSYAARGHIPLSDILLSFVLSSCDILSIVDVVPPAAIATTASPTSNTPHRRISSIVSHLTSILI